MKLPRNPYKASFSSAPPKFVGRHQIIDDVLYSIESGPGAPNRTTLVIGPRGIGKSVLVNHIANLVETDYSWLVFRENVGTGFLQRLTRSMAEALETLGDEQTKRRLSINPLSKYTTLHSSEMIDWSKSFRDILTELCGVLERLNRNSEDSQPGVLVMLDEVHHTASDMEEFAAAMNILNGEGRNIAVLMAGIPTAVNPLLAEKRADGTPNPITFIRRADRVDVSTITDADVREALRAPAPDRWTDDALDYAVSVCGGYPFMVQLVGFCAFKEARNEPHITRAHTEAGALTAQGKIGRLVHHPALNDLSDFDKSFLVAMSVDDSPSRISDIVARTKPGKKQFINNYRVRLLDADMITQPKHGYVDFALPYMREYLREHAATYGLDQILSGEHNPEKNPEKK